MSRVPRIRFKGFEEDWEQRKLGEIAERIIRKNEKLESTLPLTISAQYGLIDQNEFFDKRIASKDVRGYYLIKKGEFAYNKSTSVDAPLGAIKRLDKYKNGVLSTLYILFKIIDDTSTSSDYLVTYYATDLWHRGIQSIAAEGARNHGLLNIAPNDFFETMLSIPLNISEQKKVGDFFISLDHLITLHQRKLEKLKIIKKSMLENLFPQNGEKTPKIRFSGFTEDWEQRKFSDLYEKVIEKNDLSFGTDKIISVASMYYKEDTSNSDDDYMRTYNVMRLGDIAFEGNKSKNFAHGRFVENTIGDGIVSHVFDVFRPISEYDLLFWKYFINYEGVMGRIMIRCTKASTMMTNLVAKDFLEESIVVPSIVEQKRIGYYLKSIDHLITLHQSKSFGHILKAIVSCTLSWEQRKLEYYLEVSEEKNLSNEYTKENVLSVSGDVGIVNQIEFQGRSFAGILVNNYGVVKTGYVVYTKSPLKNNPYGIIKANKGRNGIVSTLYSIYKPKLNVNSNFIQIYFEQNARMNNYMQPLVNKGAKNDMKISSENALKGNVIFPIRKEQDIIVDLFFKIDHLITLHQSKLEKLQKIKKSMLESMFV